MKDLPISVVFYKRTKVFDQDTVPAALLKEHQTKENTWGRIVVLTGKLLYIIPSTEEILELNNILIKDNVVGILPESTKYNKKKVSTIEQATNYYKRHNRETIVNKVTRQPILIRVYCSESFEFDTPITKIYNSYFGEYNKHEDAKWNIPILSEYGMAAFYPAEEIYQDISQFLGWLVNNPEIPNKQTDTEKIVTHGFDLKESFRHRK